MHRLFYQLRMHMPQVYYINAVIWLLDSHVLHFISTNHPNKTRSFVCTLYSTSKCKSIDWKGEYSLLTFCVRNVLLYCCLLILLFYHTILAKKESTFLWWCCNLLSWFVHFGDIRISLGHATLSSFTNCSLCSKSVFSNISST